MAAYCWVPHTFAVAILKLAHKPALMRELPSFIFICFAIWAVRVVLRTQTPLKNRLLLQQKKSVMLLVITTSVILLCTFTTAKHVEKYWHTVQPIALGDPLPALKLHDLKGNVITNQDLHNQVVLIDFWATWCPACMRAMPHLKEINKEFAPRGLRFVSVNTEPNNIPHVQEFAQKNLTHPRLYRQRHAASSVENRCVSVGVDL